MSDQQKYLLFVVNVDWFFVSHRFAIAQHAMQQGYRVGIATTITNQYPRLRDAGFDVFPLKMQRSSSGLIAALHLLIQLVSIFRKIRPDIVHLVTIKPVLIGGIAARLSRIPAMLAAISGLGYVFTSRDWIARLTRLPVSLGYRFALNHNNAKIVFQNVDDQELICTLTGLPKRKAVLIRGSGVNLRTFTPSALPKDTPVVMMAARLLADKGVREFVNAANYIKSEHKGPARSARFVLVGDVDPGNAASLTVAEIEAIKASGLVELWGHRTNMHDVLPEASIVVLPSYREGLPKVLLEAAACARPVVTTDVPGCRDAIENEITGYLVQARDAAALGRSIIDMLENANLVSMGRAARALAEKEFDERIVVQRHIELYKSLLGGKHK